MQKLKTDWPQRAWLDRASLTRLVASLIAVEVSAARGRDIQQLRPDTWNGTTGIIDTGLALDSLERTNCAAALNEFFHLSDYGAEDYLLAAETLADWVDIVALSIANGSGRVTFKTSGSTGVPKACTHTLADLQREAAIWADMFAGARSIAALVPPHHIFGFLFTILLPQLADLQVHDLRYSGAAALEDALQQGGTLIVGAPVHWHYVSRSMLRIPPGNRGVTSTGPMAQHLAAQLSAQGLERLTQIYGSSETAGVGYREDPAAPYTLLEYLKLETSAEVIHRETGVSRVLMDKVIPQAGNQFSVQGRRDGAVQVAGVNVFPSRVVDMIRQQRGVADCAIRACSSRQRLVAYIVPSDMNADQSALEADLRRTCQAALLTAECPSAYTFGGHLPRNEMGKAANW